MISQPKPRRIRDAHYLRFVREQGCALCPGDAIPGAIDAHHVRPVGGGILGSKVSDYRAVGLCRFHHEMAQSHPRQYRDILEMAIDELSTKYFDLHRPKPAAERKSRERVRLEVTGCRLCGGAHSFPPAKLNYSRDHEKRVKLKWWCGSRREWVLES